MGCIVLSLSQGIFGSGTSTRSLQLRDALARWYQLDRPSFLNHQSFFSCTFFSRLSACNALLTRPKYPLKSLAVCRLELLVFLLY